jgi:hypothetical protein
MSKQISLKDLIASTINTYYTKVEEEREIRHNHEEHIKLIRSLDRQFKKELRKQEFYKEEDEGTFLKRIEYLTQAQKKYDKMKKVPVS